MMGSSLSYGVFFIILAFFACFVNRTRATKKRRRRGGVRIGNNFSGNEKKRASGLAGCSFAYVVVYTQCMDTMRMVALSSNDEGVKDAPSFSLPLLGSDFGFIRGLVRKWHRLPRHQRRIHLPSLRPKRVWWSGSAHKAWCRLTYTADPWPCLCRSCCIRRR